MANYYFDTSAFLKFYIDEDGSDTIRALAENLRDHTFVTSELTVLESRSAIRRRQREGITSAEETETLLSRIDANLSRLYFVQDISETTINEAARLIDAHPLRTLDALHLAGCLVFRSEKLAEPTFVCADIRLLDAANQEGLDILNPLLPV